MWCNHRWNRKRSKFGYSSVRTVDIF
jgi:hypothetical protein